MATAQILDDYMTLAELAEQFDRSEDTLRRWLRESFGLRDLRRIERMLTWGPDQIKAMNSSDHR